jgi:16S rRNA (guanine527-N7)-methyltransferase
VNLAAAVFGSRSDGLELATRYAQILGTTGIEHGLIGPRERERIWDRHVVNCAVLAELLPHQARVVDVGSGAGLPGLALACARADLEVVLLEPLERRVRFLIETVSSLGLSVQVEVMRGRADDPEVRRKLGRTSFVTARAVAPLDRLVRWCLPLLAPGGQLLAMKGRNAQAEIDEHADTIAGMGATEIELLTCGSSVLDEPVRVVAVRRRLTEGNIR